MIYLFLGEDIAAKDAKIAEIKQKLFNHSQDALAFDFDNLDAKDIKDNALTKAFMTLPVIAPKRLIILRQIHKLKAGDIESLFNYCKKPGDQCDVILESTEKTLKGDLKDLPMHAKGFVFGDTKEKSVFDMTRLMSWGRPADALKMLDEFYRSNMHPLQIMGALVWYWGKEGRAFGQERFERGLQALEEADLNIKRSRMDPEHAVEKLVVELVGLSRK
jgi:DNA polymerase III delta subunit